MALTEVLEAWEVMELGKFIGTCRMNSAISYSTNSVLPDGRIFGPVTQKRPQKLSMAGKELEAVNGRILQKGAEKRPENIFTFI
jgi:hypothetical protein